MRTAKSLSIAGFLLVLIGATNTARAADYKVDPAHTTVGFGVRHLFTTVNGVFRSFEGRVTFDPEHPEKSKVEGSIDAASIDTNVEKRDEHLRSPDFLDVEKYPKITFVSTQVTDVDKEKRRGKLHGELTLHGITKPIVLDVEFLGEGKDPWNNTRAGFHAATTINRRDFNVTWNKIVESGGVLVGDELKVAIDVEAIAARPGEQ
jgi:polyisoprenoid-binding protein YceI